MRSFRRSLVFALCAAAAAGFAVPASAQAYAPARVLKGVKLDDLKAIVASLEDEVVEEGISGDVSLAAKSRVDDTVYLLIGTACADTNLGCQGVNMQVRFATDGVDYATVNKVNMDEQALNTWFDAEEGTLGFSRYVVLDHGITMENLRENVTVLLAIVPDAADYFR